MQLSMSRGGVLHILRECVSRFAAPAAFGLMMGLASCVTYESPRVYISFPLSGTVTADPTIDVQVQARNARYSDCTLENLASAVTQNKEVPSRALSVAFNEFPLDEGQNALQASCHLESSGFSIQSLWPVYVTRESQQ